MFSCSFQVQLILYIELIYLHQIQQISKIIKIKQFIIYFLQFIFKNIIICLHTDRTIILTVNNF